MTKPCYNRFRKYRFPFSILITLLFVSGLVCIIYPVSAEETNVLMNGTGTESPDLSIDQSGADRDMQFMLTLLQKFGFDFSYGDDGGTVFSMVDESLTRIISSLSTGNVDGFMEIPLIRETFTYFGMSKDDIVIDPNTSPKKMEAIDNFYHRYDRGT